MHTIVEKLSNYFDYLLRHSRFPNSYVEVFLITTSTSTSTSTTTTTSTATTTTTPSTATTATTKIYSAFIKLTVDISRDKNKKKAWTQPAVYKLSVRSCPFTKLKNK